MTTARSPVLLIVFFLLSNFFIKELFVIYCSYLLSFFSSCIFCYYIYKNFKYINLLINLRIFEFKNFIFLFLLFFIPFNLQIAYCAGTPQDLAFIDPRLIDHYCLNLSLNEYQIKNLKIIHHVLYKTQDIQIASSYANFIKSLPNNFKDTTEFISFKNIYQNNIIDLTILSGQELRDTLCKISLIRESINTPFIIGDFYIDSFGLLCLKESGYEKPLLNNNILFNKGFSNYWLHNSTTDLFLPHQEINNIFIKNNIQIYKYIYTHAIIAEKMELLERIYVLKNIPVTPFLIKYGHNFNSNSMQHLSVLDLLSIFKKEVSNLLNFIYIKVS